MDVERWVRATLHVIEQRITRSTCSSRGDGPTRRCWRTGDTWSNGYRNGHERARAGRNQRLLVPEWKGNFYPEKIAAKDMLRYYAERFPTVEINNTFYRMPTASVLGAGRSRCPEQLLVRAQGAAPHHARSSGCRTAAS